MALPRGRIGLAGAAALLALAVVPYAVLPEGTVGVYYGAGPVGPPVLVGFAAVATVALSSSAAGRADPATGAGVAVTLSAFAAVLGGLWALAAGDAAGGIETSSAFGYHRWAFAAATVVLFGAALAQARAVLSE